MCLAILHLNISNNVFIMFIYFYIYYTCSFLIIMLAVTKESLRNTRNLESVIFCEINEYVFPGRLH